jgi:hypothetical protein
MPRVQTQKDVISDLKRENRFLSIVTWDIKLLISREICKPVFKTGFYGAAHNGIPLRIWTQHWNYLRPLETRSLGCASRLLTALTSLTVICMVGEGGGTGINDLASAAQLA